MGLEVKSREVAWRTDRQTAQGICQSQRKWKEDSQSRPQTLSATLLSFRPHDKDWDLLSPKAPVCRSPGQASPTSCGKEETGKRKTNEWWGWGGWGMVPYQVLAPPKAMISNPASTYMWLSKWTLMDGSMVNHSPKLLN